MISYIIINVNPPHHRSPSSASMTPVQIATAAAAQLTAAAASAADDTPRKRRKQTHVPDANKDERYWTRRLKNNEAAKRSRDMRIKRERVVFEENQRLENMNKELRLEMDKFITENKELRLKMDIVMEDNARLKNLLVSYQTADQVRRYSSVCFCCSCVFNFEACSSEMYSYSIIMNPLQFEMPDH